MFKFIFFLILIPQIVFADNTTCLHVKMNINISSKKAILLEINKINYYSQKLQIGDIRYIASQNNWYIVDVPDSILVYKYQSNKFVLVDSLSGDFYIDGDVKQTIIEYFTKEIKQAPKELFYCTAGDIAKNWK